MPWTTKDATRHQKKAKSDIAKRQWRDVANSILQRTGDEGRAVRGANAAVDKRHKKKRHSGHGRGRRRKMHRGGKRHGKR